MNTPISTQLKDIALGALESLEMRALAWGFVDQAIDEDEAEEAIASALAAEHSDTDAAEVLDSLVESALVRLIRDGSSRRYRTRFAELTRLLLRLRQWFTGTTWQAAPTLVADYRVDVRPRRYPRRDITSTVAWQEIDPDRRYTALQLDLWRALTAQDAGQRLAAFQVAACRRLLAADRGSATIVTAGTGSGKTLAFYLPAFVRAGPEIRKSEWWTKIVCIYPRQELLKDQLSEAYRVSIGAAPALERDGRRPLVFGSLFGATPREPSESAVEQAGWTGRPAGYICPFLRCPVCSGELVWSRDALQSRREELRCGSASCTGNANYQTVRLTRQSIQRQPPDFLFTTTEMMNQRLSDTQMRKVFGVGLPVARAPLMTLLDEAHTYAGISGAQTALLLRRWSALLGIRMRWAGLSATLPNATQFFGDLTGTSADAVAVIEPARSEFVEEGAEYHVVLRSDPASQTATLSTSIQTIMLLARMLDRRDEDRSDGSFGSRTFVFTDDLDVTHRLYDDVLDAEAYDARRRPDPSRAPLAALRSSTQPDAVNREREGQRWQMAEDLRHSLNDRLAIGRTTSRDPGVDVGVDVIVATSALEVGFNDPNVGAVVQHKAPRSAASFLQRRGRAGRPRSMRPITVVVLSDYGRDRLAFQSYEQLFDPTVQIASLPTKNLYVLRMQAVYATLDWIAAQYPAEQLGWAWRALGGPARSAHDTAFQQHTKTLVQKIIQGDQTVTDRYRSHLQAALGVDADTLNLILWYPPRALMLEALPTLARRLVREWRLADGSGLDLHVQDPPHPLPDFVPANLFSDLNLPEVQVVVPGPTIAREAMPITSALGQFVPGRVRRRFADRPGNVSHWVPINVDVPASDIRIDQYATQSEFVGSFRGVRDGYACDFPVFRPWEVPISSTPQRVGTRSNAYWLWQSDFATLGRATYVDIPSTAGISGVIDRIDVHLHRLGSGVSVRRFAPLGHATPRVNGQERFIQFRIVDGNQNPAAIGFAFEADALAIDVRVPHVADDRLALVPPETIRWIRYLALKAKTESSQTLPWSLNAFRREWLHQVVLLTAVILAEQRGISLTAALDVLRRSNGPAVYNDAMQALTSGFVPPDPDDDDGSPLPPPTRLHQTLANCLADPSVAVAVIDLVAQWVTPDNDSWQTWIGELLSATLSEAIYQACITALPQSAPTEGLTVDVIGEGMNRRVIVAETALGGGGILEALAESFAEDPRAFVRALESACAASDHELASAGLRQVLSLASENNEVAEALARLRTTAGASAKQDARIALFDVLARQGLPVSRTLSVLLATRLLRPGSDETGDQLSLSLFRAWGELEQRHGIALPMRVAIPALVKTSSALRGALANIGGTGREILAANLLTWPIGGELRQRALQSYNPYRPTPYVDASLLRYVLLETRLPVVLFEASGWHAIANEALASQGSIRLLIRHGVTDWRTAVVAMLDVPVTSGFLHFYPMIEAVRLLDNGYLAVDLVLRERT